MQAGRASCSNVMLATKQAHGWSAALPYAKSRVKTSSIALVQETVMFAADEDVCFEAILLLSPDDGFWPTCDLITSYGTLYRLHH